MSDDVNPSKSSSAVKKLVHAAALAAVLVPLGSIASEASPITCGFGGAEGDFCTVSSTGPEPFGSGTVPYGRYFSWGPYELQLDFEDINTPFLVTINDVIVTQGDVASRFTDNFPGYLCVPIADGVSSCVEFEVQVTDQDGEPFESGSEPFDGAYNMFISWFAPTDGTYPNTPGGPPGGRIRILHNLGSTSTTDFETDITTPGSYDALAFPLTDPGVGGGDDNFQSFIVAQSPLDEPLPPAPVPEPSSLVLLGTGAAAVYRKLRASKTNN